MTHNEETMPAAAPMPTAADAPPTETVAELRAAYALLMSQYDELADKHNNAVRRYKLAEKRIEGASEAAHRVGYNQALDDKGRELDIAEYVDKFIAGDDNAIYLKLAMEGVTRLTLEMDANTQEEIKGLVWLTNSIVQLNYIATYH